MPFIFYTDPEELMASSDPYLWSRGAAAHIKKLEDRQDIAALLAILNARLDYRGDKARFVFDNPEACRNQFLTHAAIKAVVRLSAKEALAPLRQLKNGDGYFGDTTTAQGIASRAIEKMMQRPPMTTIAAEIDSACRGGTKPKLNISRIAFYKDSQPG